MRNSIVIIFFIICFIQISAQTVNSDINPTIKGRASLSVGDFELTNDAPSIGDLNFFSVPKSLSSLNPASEPMITRSGGVNVYKQVAPSVVKVMHDEGSGSGIIISLDGFIVTNWHVVRGWKTVYVILFNQKDNADRPIYLLADVIKTDPKVDLALIKLQKSSRSLKVIKFGLIPEIGTEVHAIGHPYGEDWTYTKGYISQIRKAYYWDSSEVLESGERQVLAGHTADVVQTQTPINPGNSGGPLTNQNAQLIGINTFGIGRAGVNFAVSVKEVQSFINSEKQEYGPIVDPKLFIGEHDYNRDGSADIWAYDMDGDGVIDVAAYDSNFDGKIDGYNLVIIDREDNLVVIGSIFPDEVDGRIEIVWLIDRNDDGTAEGYGIDYNRDGRPDFFRKL